MKVSKKKLLKKASAKKPLRKASAKAQSAMEYLMTYGWAILIISVVLAALYQLGVFNPMTFAPKAPPGACQVFRPNGPGTTSFINLEGVCSGELPQYVAQFQGNNYIIVPSSTFPNNQPSVTASAWIDISPSEGQYGGIVSIGSTCGSGGQMLFEVYNYFTALGVYVGIVGSGGAWYTFPYPFKSSAWYYVAAVYNSGTLSVYVNGQLLGSTSTGTITTLPENGNSGIGIGVQGSTTSNLCNWFSGLISNVQIYNTSLSANEIQALYLEGIGGAPIRLQNLVAWYPLDGNANDYSGDGNNGQIISGLVLLVTGTMAIRHHEPISSLTQNKLL